MWLRLPRAPPRRAVVSGRDGVGIARAPGVAVALRGRGRARARGDARPSARWSSALWDGRRSTFRVLAAGGDARRRGLLVGWLV